MMFHNLTVYVGSRMPSIDLPPGAVARSETICDQYNGILDETQLVDNDFTNHVQYNQSFIFFL